MGIRLLDLKKMYVKILKMKFFNFDTKCRVF
jgi:hypothetical protein